jgi:hypothetical protein
MSEQLPDSAVASGSGAGAPGEAPSGDLDELSPDERALLEELRRPGRPVVEPVEEDEQVAAAARDDAPL